MTPVLDLRAFAESLSNMAWRTTREGLTDYVNAAWQLYTGIGLEESRGAGWLAAIHPDDVAGVEAAWQLALRDGDEFDAQFRVRNREGRYRWFIGRATPMRDAEGRIAYWFGTCTDIDRQKRSGDEFRAIAEAIPQMVWTARPDGTIDYLNRRIQEYAGDVRRGWESAIHPDDLGVVLAVWRQALRDGAPCEVECRLRRADGVYRWFIVRASSVRDAGSGAISRWFGTCTDIDDLRKAAARNAFIAGADALFATELDPDAILRAVGRAAVESFCDYCLFDRSDADGTLRRVVAEHRDEIRRIPFQRSVGQTVPLAHPVHPIAIAWHDRRNIVVPQIDAEWWRRAAADESHYERMRDEGLSSLITVLVSARDRRYGALTFCRSRGSQPYDEDDLATAEDLARRIAAALDNARLYADARANAERQRRIAERETFYGRLAETVGESLELEKTLDAATRLLVPEYADWAVINLVGDEGLLYLAASRHRDPAANERAEQLLHLHYLSADARGGSPEVVRSRRSLLYARVGKDGIGAVAGPYREAILALGVSSAAIVPLVFGGVARGTIALMYDRTSGRSYGTEDLPFFEEIARRLAPAVANAEAYQRERRVARTFQAAALTTDLPKLEGTTFDALYEAGRSEALIGGDWYDAFRVADGRIVVSIGDVAGSGLDAAATMATIRQSLRGAAAINPDPSVMLDAADRVLRSQAPQRFVTAWVGVLDPVWSTLACAGAGHPAPLQRDAAGTVRELPAGGLPLGLRERGTDVTRHLDLAPRMTLLLYTDGLTEARHDLLAGERALAEAFRTVDVRAAPARALHRAVLGADGAGDDVAILVLAFERALLAIGGDRAATSWSFDALDGEAASQTRHAIVDLLERRGVPDDDRIIAELIYSELVGNVARYAPGTIDVAVDCSADLAVLHVIDRGSGFQHNARLPSDALAENGRGLYIVSTIAEEFSVTRCGSGGAHARAVLKGTLKPVRRALAYA